MTAKGKRTFTPRMRKFFDAMDNCDLVSPFNEPELLKIIARREPEYALAYIKGVVEISCFEAIRPLLDTPKKAGKT